jgi:hypothetical protein
MENLESFIVAWLFVIRRLSFVTLLTVLMLLWPLEMLKSFHLDGMMDFLMTF